MLSYLCFLNSCTLQCYIEQQPVFTFSWKLQEYTKYRHNSPQSSKTWSQISILTSFKILAIFLFPFCGLNWLLSNSGNRACTKDDILEKILWYNTTSILNDKQWKLFKISSLDHLDYKHTTLSFLLIFL